MAVKAREGKFEAADGGTLFLDEIGNLPLAGQMKLLRVLETGRFERLGSNKERQVKVRVISATNADLATMIKAGQFREDLFYRLNVIQINLPPLVERPGDILPLAQHFLSDDKRLHNSAQTALLQHHWPGNVCELKNVMQRASLLSAGNEIKAGDLGLPISTIATHPANVVNISNDWPCSERSAAPLSAIRMGITRSACTGPGRLTGQFRRRTGAARATDAAAKDTRNH